MNFQFYVEKLRASEKFKEFIKSNPDAFPCSCFFVIDMEGKDNQQHFDYWILKDKKMFSFKIESGELAPLEFFDEKVPEKISLDLEFDFKEIKDMVEKRKEQEGIKNKTQKYIFSLQRKDAKHYLIGTVFISLLGMLKVHVNLESMEVDLFEKKSFFDVMKVKGK